MELLPLVCLCLLSCSGETSAAGDGVKVVVKEDDDAVLPCSLSNKEDITRKLFDWKKDGQKEVFFYDSGIHYNNGKTGQDEQFRGRVSHFQDQLKNGDASIKIRKTKMADSGNYSCDFPRLQRQTFIIELVVGQVLRDRTGENIPGAAPRPFIATLDQTKDWSLLQCEAHGDPLPTVEWKDSENNTLHAEKPQFSERGGRSYITVKTTVTKTDNYSCVATQETISHRIAAVTFVHLTGAASKPYVSTRKTDDGTVLQCEVLGASPKPKVEWRDSSGNILPVKDLKVTERGDSYDIVLQAALTETDNFRCVVTQEEISHKIYAEIDATVNGSSAGWIVAGVVSLLLVGVVILLVLTCTGCIKLNYKKKSGEELAGLNPTDP
ncbi:V-set domain-containing T-cell activation inhibitor 1-like isoform X2 [Pagrus major]|uniref:V-set domain-containing T-cell activation inhibitor 1-like isoform X2 n=1 Tax=Pagrus major TaxID=143350 RepID=UPI003CC8679F